MQTLRPIRLEQVSKTDLQQTFVRLAMTFALLAFLPLFPQGGQWSFDRTDTYLLVVTYLAGSLLMLVWTVTSTDHVKVRRYSGMALDVVGTHWAMHVGAENGIICFGIALWNIIAFGLRYGKGYMRASRALHLLGFSWVVNVTPFWNYHIVLSIALALILYLIPEYIERLLDSHSNATAEATAATEAKSRFVATVSHEIRTPLNSIIAATTLLKAPIDVTEQWTLVSAIDISSKQLLALVNDVLDLSRLEAGKIDVALLPMRPALVAGDVVSSLRPEAMRKGIALALSLDESSLPMAFFGDVSMVRQVLTNLVGNAIKFTERGGVNVSLTMRNIDSNEIVVFAISDTGIGIAPEKYDAVFEPFRQLDQSANRRHQGSGLGTTLARQYVEAMGGRILLASRLGEGSTFTVELPLKRCLPSESLPELPTSPIISTPLDLWKSREDFNRLDFGFTEDSRPPGASQQPTILVIEDHDINRMVLKRLLQCAGYLVRDARNGVEGLRRLAESEYSVVVLDMDMPMLSGLDVIAAYRRLMPSRRAPKWVMITGHATEEQRLDSMQGGVDEFFLKPVVPNLFLRCLYSIASDVAEQLSRRSILNAEKLATQFERTDEDHQFLAELSEHYQVDGHRLLVSLRTALIAQKFDAVAHLLHALAGVAAEVGDKRTNWLARQQLDLAKRAGSSLVSLSLVDALDKSCRIGSESLALFVEATKPALQSELS
jgi:two-component system sensor histidine kinase RpfC